MHQTLHQSILMMKKYHTKQIFWFLNNVLLAIMCLLLLIAISINCYYYIKQQSIAEAPLGYYNHIDIVQIGTN